MYLDVKPGIPIAGGIKIPYHSFQGIVNFNNVHFSYPTRPEQPILQDLSLDVPSGTVVAVVGSSGAGKSTIASLLERFYDIDRGSITIDKLDIRRLDPAWLRGQAIGYIAQEPVLFSGTIYENILYAKPDATPPEIYKAARQANADAFILSFPHGYNTVVGERGVALSGGQKQRIAIARALVKRPRILVLDEATSALDYQSEKAIQATLEEAMKGKTVFVIAHRLSTVKRADMICVLHDGRFVETGTHDQLMRKRKHYYKLVSQLED